MLGALQQLTFDSNTATSGADSYWLRSFSASIEYSCDGCVYSHSDGSSSAVIATEALVATQSTPLASRVQSGRVTDDFSVQLVDFYGHSVTSELTPVTCTITPVTASSTHARHQLEISGSTSAATSAGLATFSGSILRGELDHEYVAITNYMSFNTMCSIRTFNNSR